MSTGPSAGLDLRKPPLPNIPASWSEKPAACNSCTAGGNASTAQRTEILTLDLFHELQHASHAELDKR